VGVDQDYPYSYEKQEGVVNMSKKKKIKKLEARIELLEKIAFGNCRPSLETAADQKENSIICTVHYNGICVKGIKYFSIRLISNYLDEKVKVEFTGPNSFDVRNLDGNLIESFDVKEM
jgi:hypothetical protein